jgi:hypothetical protein
MYSDSCAAAYSGYRVRIHLIHALPRRAGKGGLLASVAAPTPPTTMATSGDGVLCRGDGCVHHRPSAASQPAKTFGGGRQRRYPANGVLAGTCLPLPLHCVLAREDFDGACSSCSTCMHRGVLQQRPRRWEECHFHTSTIPRCATASANARDAPKHW